MNNNFKYKLIALVLASGAGVALSNAAYAAEPFVTLKDMVEKTVTSNPEVQSRYHRFLESGFEQDVVRGGFLPKADIVSTYRKQEELLKPADGTSIPRFNNELVLRQMIFDGFATSNEVKRLGHANRVRYYELQSTMQNTTLEFMRAYIDTMRYRELSQFAKDNYVVHKQLFDRIQERVNAGVARKVDLEQASGRLALAEANLLTETTNLHDVTARLQRLYGELPPETLEAPTFFNAGVEPTSAEALKVAYNQNPDLLSTIEDIQASKNEIKTREARYMPKLDLQARKNLGVSSDGRYSSSAADLLELTMNFNLFNGFSDQNAVKMTAEKLNNSKDLRDKACVDTRQIVVIAYNDIQQLKEQEKYRTNHKNSIENAREAYRKQFDIGQRTLLDLLDTENEYFQAKRSLTNTQFDIQTAYARTYAGQGELLNKIGAARGGLPEYKRESYMDNENVCQAIAPVQVVVDKAELLANAKPLSSTLTTLKTPEPAKIEIKPLANKVVPDVQFETNSAKIKAVSYPVLDNAIITLKEWGDSSVEIAGHTDQRDTSKADYNQALSEKRAKAVLEYVVKKGVDAKRLTAKGYGFSQPIAENDPKEGNAVNRRVELIRQ
ncbi:MAG: TolC family outer membrane protein [Methylotenera sp.]|uniref:TolC family outer membrane protein n=1 Tax=Methylotenera sp. TaxID=2051956 RepID=UPI002725CB18|nr:TolC family outer membrane protein [Methylotenera sp.]MDO9206279.1 TolC family outer membrane protein [Methylotenera sp.]MDO9392746.1 TolC family outer membrane protein [Methylotenera sp.]MDP2231813.1 TolC family outer membrane protein [Methylotenera sp.]MDP3307004.1 TolC family outer membrane protein [Methylotenera sp.]MDP3818412.1 TolC family outer membrane protein [Methylotenera sp.]